MSPDIPKTSRPVAPPFRLGDLDILPGSNEIRGRRGTERLRPLLMDILVRLAVAPGEVIRRETLLEEVWPRRMVNDEVLSRAIAELRTALGDDARSARFIETVPKIGYRLVAPVGPLGEITPPPRAQAAPRAVRRTALAAVIAAFGLAAGLAWLLHSQPRASADAGLEGLLAAAQPFASDPANEVAPRFSRDGRFVAYAFAAGEEARIAIQPIDGSPRRVIAASGHVLHSPVFFPDGERIAMWRRNGGDCAIVEHHLRTGAERVLVGCALAPRPRFDLSPDGTFVVFTGDTRPQYPAGLWMARLDGSAPTPLTEPEPAMGEDLFPRVSPDSTQVIFFRGGESHRKPWIVNARDPRDLRVAANIEGLSYGAAWLAPAGPVITAADWFGFRAINVLDPARGEARLAGARGARFPDVSSRGDVVYEIATYAANLWLVDATAPSSARALWPSTRYTNQPEFSPDGTRVAFSSNREATDALYVAAPDAAALRITAGTEFRYIRPHWSADGRSVLAIRIATRAPGATDQRAVRIPAAGGAEEVLDKLGTAVASVAESPDATTLYYGEIAGNAMRMMRAPASMGGPAERLPLPLATEFQVNAERIVFAQPQISRLTACVLRDLACEQIALDVPEEEHFHWKLGPRSLFLRVHGETEGIGRYDFAARRIVEVIPFAATGTGTSIAVAPDEKRLVVVREEGPAIDLMLARRVK